VFLGSLDIGSAALVGPLALMVYRSHWERHRREEYNRFLLVLPGTKGLVSRCLPQFE
jgi:hypothetical protein